MWPTDGRTLFNVMERADGALHQAKRVGRNRTVRYVPAGRLAGLISA